MAEHMVMADFATLVEEDLAARVAIARGRPVPPSPHTEAQRMTPRQAQLRRGQIHRDEEAYRTALRVQAHEAREHGRPGTPPPNFLPAEQAKLCHDFLDYMRERHDYYGATELRHAPRLGWLRRSAGWSIRGYGIGVFPVGWDALRSPSGAGSHQERITSISPDQVAFGDTPPKEARSYEAMLPGTTGEYNAFLCEDDLVRLWISRKAAGSLGSYGATYTGDDPPSVITEVPRANDPPRVRTKGPWLTRVLVDYAVEAELAALARSRIAGTTGPAAPQGVPLPGWPPAAGPRHVPQTPPPALPPGH
ncbi:MAG TPA: hypothetical protein VD706_00715 [Candidatus Saccharimonadales bacterium]|nr:hypothetical protein [Candidatus Saccharimonadales bacterium]